jgi:signal transduction histidine kinase
MKVLIADDKEESRYLLEKMLEGHGYQVMAVSNGAEALGQALVQSPDIIISDILMPKMDGFQLCHECKRNEQLKNIPFIFYTATYTSSQDEKFALTLGAHTFIRKPTEPNIFLKILFDAFVKTKSRSLALAKVSSLEPSLYLTEYNKRITAKLEDKVTELERKITERRQAEKRLKNAYHELRRTQDQLIQNEKIVTVGRLASGVAHQIRNPLQSIVLGVEFLSSTLAEKDEKSEKCIRKIKGVVDRANKIITDILRFSRASQFKIESVDICKLLDETMHLIEPRIDLSNTRINQNYPQESVKVKADKNMLQQVFVNLFTNALDSMPKGGEIKIKVYNKITTQIRNKVGYRTSDYFKIGEEMTVVEVEDTGKDIPKEVLPKIFEPFLPQRN